MTLEARNALKDAPIEIPGYKIEITKDSVTGYEVVTYCPEDNFNGTCDVFFSGYNNTCNQSVKRMGLEKLLEQKKRAGDNSAFSISIGNAPGADPKKYDNLRNKGAFSAMMRAIEAKTGAIGTINIAVNSAGGAGWENVAYEVKKNCDPIGQKINNIVLGDATYGSTDATKRFALEFDGCHISVKYLDFEGSGTKGNAEWLRKQGLKNVTVDGEKVKKLTLARHLGLAREGILEMTGSQLGKNIEDFSLAANKVGENIKGKALDVGEYALSQLGILATEKYTSTPLIAFNGTDFTIKFATRDEYKKNRLQNLIPPEVQQLTNIKNARGDAVSALAYRKSNGKFYDKKTDAYIPVDNGYTGTIVPPTKRDTESQLGNV